MADGFDDQSNNIPLMGLLPVTRLPDLSHLHLPDSIYNQDDRRHIASVAVRRDLIINNMKTV